MTVYELIKKLSEFEADDEVVFSVRAEFDADVKAEFDRENQDDEQEVTVTAVFDDKVSFDDIHKKYYEKDVVIELNY